MSLQLKRIGFVDFLKTIGFFCLVLAHVSCPNILLMMRNFDVPLLVILSGVLAGNSNKNNYISYLSRRFVRLVLPTWIFLAFYFSIIKIFGGGITSEIIIKSFLLQQDGIGYVWIIMVYLICACSIPLLMGIKNRTGCVILLIIYLIYEIMYFLKIGINNRLFYNTFYYFPYVLLTWYGMVYRDLNAITRRAIAIISGAIFVGLFTYYYSVTNNFVSTQIAKYPPRIYYLSYGICVSTALMLMTENKEWKAFSSYIVSFTSKHSLWLYLWHIMVLSISNKIGIPKYGWLVQYIIILICTYFITITQSEFVKLLEKKKSYRWLKVLKG